LEETLKLEGYTPVRPFSTSVNLVGRDSQIRGLYT